MMHHTHLVFGFLVAFIALNLLSIGNPLLFILVVLLFSVFPDIDKSNSKVGRKAGILSKLFNLFGHRGIFHSLFFPVVFFILLSLVNFDAGLAAFLGYLSHLLLDSFTKAGIRPFYPMRYKIKGPVKTNSFLEKILFLVLAVSDLYLVLL